jgi:hypothetical protein
VLIWHDGVVIKLVQAFQDERAFSPDRLAILADELEEAGRPDAELLSCRWTA